MENHIPAICKDTAIQKKKIAGAMGQLQNWWCQIRGEYNVTFLPGKALVGSFAANSQKTTQLQATWLETWSTL